MKSNIWIMLIVLFIILAIVFAFVPGVGKLSLICGGIAFLFFYIKIQNNRRDLL